MARSNLPTKVVEESACGWLFSMHFHPINFILSLNKKAAQTLLALNPKWHWFLTSILIEIRFVCFKANPSAR